MKEQNGNWKEGNVKERVARSRKFSGIDMEKDAWRGDTKVERKEITRR